RETALAGSEHAGHGEYDGRLAVRRRKLREDLEDLVVARDALGPFAIHLAAPRRLARCETLVPGPGVVDIAHPSILPDGLRRMSGCGNRTTPRGVLYLYGIRGRENGRGVAR